VETVGNPLPHFSGVILLPASILRTAALSHHPLWPQKGVLRFIQLCRLEGFFGGLRNISSRTASIGSSFVIQNSMVNCIAGLLPNLFPHPLALPNVHAMLLSCELPKAVVPV
jgi:hypothetical protein